MVYQKHIPVLTAEVIKLFHPGSNDTLLDATVGTGGHAAAYLAASAPGGTVVGLDADAQAIAAAKHYLADYHNRVTLLTANFAFLKDSLTGGGILKPEASSSTDIKSILSPEPTAKPGLAHQDTSSRLFTHILFDLGLGSHQLDDPKAGFSFLSHGPLDMKYGQTGSLPESMFQFVNYATKRLGHFPNASELIAMLSATELRQVIKTFGEERYAGRIAQAIKEHLPTTTQDLVAVIKQVTPFNYEHGRINPATRTFQALRLAVNRELEALSVALPQAVDLLAEHGTIVVISFHSLEDRIVKQFFRQSSLDIITKKPITGAPAEINRNPRARTAKLRAAIKKPPS